MSTAREDALRRQQASIAAELAAIAKTKELERLNQETLNGARVLALNSPSPKKKRAREDAEFRRSTRPRAPDFSPYDSTEAAPPEYTYEDTFLAKANKISAFASHDSALPCESSMIIGLSAMAKKQKLDLEKKKKAQTRSTGFSLPGAQDRERRRDAVGGGGRDGVARAGGSGSSRIGTGSGGGSGSGKGKERETARPSTRSAADTKLANDLDRKPTASRHVAKSAAVVPRAPRNKVEKREEDEDASDDGDEDGLDVIGGPPKGATKRRKDWTVIEKIELGPREFKFDRNDPHFDKIEPNSGIRLRLRTPRRTSHEQLQLHLSDRYHVSPAHLYSLARVTANNNVEIDIDRDFIVIGVLAWKDETRYVQAPKSGVKEEVKKKPWEKVKGTEEAPTALEAERDTEAFRPDTAKARRYIRFTLVDLSTEAAAASGTGTLNLMLFEATSEDTVVEDDGYKVSKYRGGSGGAYEKFWKESPGAVVAILNPRVSRTKSQTGKPNIFTIIPESADAMMVIGQARDLRSCEATRRDTGKPCGDWCDARVSNICEFHTNLQLKHTSSRRAETYSANSSLLSNTNFDKRKFIQAFKPPSSRTSGSSKAPYDPVTKMGLLPRNPSVSMIGEHKTYVVSAPAVASTRPQRGGLTAANLRPANSILHGNGGGPRYIAGVQDGLSVRQYEKEREAREVDRAVRKEAERELMGRDEGKTLGGQYIELAAKARRKLAREKEEKEGREGKQAKEKEARRRRLRGDEDEDPDAESGTGSEEGEGSGGEERWRKKKPFSTTAVRLIGYDPTRMGEVGIEEDEAGRIKRLEAISSLAGLARPTPNLGPPPGPRIRSVQAANNFKPSRKAVPSAAEARENDADDEDLPDLYQKIATKPPVAPPVQEEDEDSDDDLVVLPKEVREAASPVAAAA